MGLLHPTNSIQTTQIPYPPNVSSASSRKCRLKETSSNAILLRENFHHISSLTMKKDNDSKLGIPALNAA